MVRLQKGCATGAPGYLSRPARTAVGAILLGVSVTCIAVPGIVLAQSYSFSAVQVQGNDHVDPATILKFAGIGRGQQLSAAQLNDAYQRVMGSGLFETVEMVPSGGTLIIRVAENPTISTVGFEGNQKMKDEVLAKMVKSQSRRMYSAAQAEADAATIAAAYADTGRMAAKVDPKIIRRDGNRVDLVFEVREGKVTEVERLSFTGNRAFTDRRLRQVLQTKQAGLLRNFIQRDTYVPDRLEFDKQLLTDFYHSRGFIDAQVLGVASEFSRERDGFFLTFNVREGLQYKFGQPSVVSTIDGVNAADYQNEIRVRPGTIYTPVDIDTTISRMETLALKKGINFLRVEPRVVRNEAAQVVDVQFVISKGPRVFVERIDIEGNATTLDKVVRRQFHTVEGDPFNPREIRQAAERIRALGYFSKADVNANPGSNGDQVIVDVNVEEQPTGSLGFGVTYGVAQGIGLNVSFQETNFLGRGQTLSVNLATASKNGTNSISFIEPAVLDRDLKFKFNAWYNTSDNDYALYSTKKIGVSPSIEFPISELTRLELRYSISSNDMYNYTGDDPVGPPIKIGSPIIMGEVAQGAQITSALGYTLSYDTRTEGLNPHGGVLLRFGQDFAGIAGDIKSVSTSALVSAERRIWNDGVTLRAEVEGGALHMVSGTSRVIDRFSGSGKIRGFEPNGIGPRDLGATDQDALGGNMYAVARFEAEFPLGLPEEYGIRGGLFADVGSVWGLDNTAGINPVDDGLKLRSAVGVSLFWKTPVGPLRFNFSHAIQKESYDKEQTFDLTVSTKF